jgi:G3E family GTPase
MDRARYIMIGGFLGSGKTTAILRLADRLKREGRRVGLITNDQSIDLVDTARARAAGFPVEEITGGCFCCKFDSLIQASQALTRATAPDVLIAEPVGSCTDLKATVGYPLRQMYNSDYTVAPLSVVVDPLRCAGILGLIPGKCFSDKVVYVYRKQLEEAELIVVNKTDLIDEALRGQLDTALAHAFPHARRMYASTRTGVGLKEWFDILLSGTLGVEAPMEVDYDRYAEGEALLGWLNARAEVSSPASFDGNTFLLTLARDVSRRLVESDAQIAHLKMTLVPSTGPDLASVSLTRNDEQPQATHAMDAPLDRGRLVVNLRAEADPEFLRKQIETALASVDPVRAQVTNVAAFRPGRPSPSHRVSPCTCRSRRPGNKARQSGGTCEASKPEAPIATRENRLPPSTDAVTDAEEGVIGILQETAGGRPLTKAEAERLLSLPEDSLEAALLRSTANAVSRKRFSNSALLLGQIGVDMAPCDGNCAFCFFAKSHATFQASTLPTDEVLARCDRFAKGGAQGVFLMTMHRFRFEWFRDLCAKLRSSVPPHLEILANVGDIDLSQLKELRSAGVSGAYHVCRLKEGIDSCMDPTERRATIERIIEAGIAWYTLCEPIGPEHTPHELAEQMWLGVELPCRQHGAMQRFPVPGSPLFAKGQISLSRLGQIVAVIALATQHKKEMTSIAVNVSNIVGLFSGANAFFPEACEPDATERPQEGPTAREGFTTALWRRSNEITTADCRDMLTAAGFSQLNDTRGNPRRPLLSHAKG